MGLVYFSEPDFTFRMGLDYNSTCLNGDVVQIYSGGGDKGKVMHRMGGWCGKNRL